MVSFHRKFLRGVVVCVEVDNAQNTFYCLVKYRFIKASVFYCLYDLGIVESAGTGHFQIKTGLKTWNTVVDSAPVGHYISFKAPVSAQHISQKPFIFGSKSAVDLVVRAHKRIRLCFFDGCLKCREIDFAQRAFINLGGAAHTVVLLVVSCKMLD